MQVDRRSPRPQTPRNDLRDSGSISSRRYHPRPNSAKVAEKISARRNLLTGKIRSNSARAKPTEIEEPVIEISDHEMHIHKVGCPWLKARSSSKYTVGVSESSSGIMHPKPWGARNPTDIPCFCHLPHRSSKENQQIQKPPKSQQAEIPPPNKNCKAKIADIVDNFGIFLERRKIRITENEVPFLTKKLEEKIQKFVDKSKQEQKDQSKKNKNVRNQSPIQRPHTTAPQKTLSREQLLDLQKAKMSGQGQPNILGKLETKKYLLELTAEEPVPPNFRNILGMNPTIIHQHPDKMLIAMDEKQPYLAIPEDYRHYSMKTIDMDNYTGVVHHQAENTTLLLASNPAIGRRTLHTPPQTLMQKPHHLGYKQVRRS